MGMTALALAPIFLLICLGYGLRRGGIPSDEFWNLNDRLVYFVLMPALFFVQVSTSDLSNPDLLPFALTLYTGFFAALAFGVAVALMLGRSRETATSIAQGASRFNTFVALAVAEALHGAEGLGLAVLGAAVLVPLVNVASVGLFAVMLPRAGRGRIWSAVRMLATNPLILAILAGIAVNAAGWGAVPVLTDTLDVLGQAGLPIMLLCVGANLKIAGLRAEAVPMVLAAVGKFAVFPLGIVAAALVLGLSPLAAQVALIYAALPAGVAAYTLSRQFGGNAPLMAAIITGQTLLAFAVMPLWLALGARLFAP